MSLTTPRKGYKSVPWLFGKEIEIPQEWEIVKLNEISKLQGGYAFKSEDYQEQGIQLLKIVNVSHGEFNWNDKSFVPKNYWNEYDDFQIKKGDIILAMTRPIISGGLKIAIFNEMENILLNQRVGKFILQNVDSYFFFCMVNQKSVIDQIITKIGESGQPNISSDEVGEIKICYNSNIQEQQKIATILSNVDNLIESTGKVITHSKKVKTGLMQKLLTRGIGHTKFKKITMGLRYMIETYPEEWIISTLGKNAELQRGKFGHRPRDDPEFYGGKYPFIQTGDVEKSNKYILTYSQTLNEKGLKVSKTFPKGIIVITIAANIGSTSITTFDTCFPDSLIGISTNSMNIEFLEYFMTTRKNYLNAVATTSAQKNINYETLKPLKIPVPPLPEQKQIATILSNMDSQIDSQEQYKEKLERLKKSLMQKLLTGEVRV